MSVLYWRARNWMHYSKCVSPGLSSGEDHLPHPAGNTFPNATQDTVGRLCCKHALVQPVVYQHPQDLYYRLLSCKSALSLCWCIGLFLPSCRTHYLPLLNLIRFPSAHFPACWCFCDGSITINNSSLFLSSASLLRFYSVLSSRSLIKLIINDEHIGPWETSLVVSSWTLCFWLQHSDPGC